MKRFESLADPELNKKFIKQYILVHKTGNEYNVDKSIESQYDYIGETENNLNEYVLLSVLKNFCAATINDSDYDCSECKMNEICGYGFGLKEIKDLEELLEFYKSGELKQIN